MAVGTRLGVPGDLIPYWDMDAPEIPNEYRDASSAAVMASALYEISTMDVNNPQQYKKYADYYFLEALKRKRDIEGK